MVRLPPSPPSPFCLRSLLFSRLWPLEHFFRPALNPPSLFLKLRPELGVLTSDCPLELHGHVFRLYLCWQIHEALLEQPILTFLGIFARILSTRVIKVVQLEIVRRCRVHC